MSIAVSRAPDGKEIAKGADWAAAPLFSVRTLFRPFLTYIFLIFGSLIQRDFAPLLISPFFF